MITLSTNYSFMVSLISYKNNSIKPSLLCPRYFTMQPISVFQLQKVNSKWRYSCVSIFKVASLYKPTRPSDLNDKINFLSSHRFVVRIHSVLSKIYYMSDIQRILTKHVINVFIWIESNTCYCVQHIQKN